MLCHKCDMKLEVYTTQKCSANVLFAHILLLLHHIHKQSSFCTALIHIRYILVEKTELSCTNIRNLSQNRHREVWFEFC